MVYEYSCRRRQASGEARSSRCLIRGKAILDGLWQWRRQPLYHGHLTSFETHLAVLVLSMTLQLSFPNRLKKGLSACLTDDGQSGLYETG